MLWLRFGLWKEAVENSSNALGIPYKRLGKTSGGTDRQHNSFRKSLVQVSSNNSLISILMTLQQFTLASRQSWDQICFLWVELGHWFITQSCLVFSQVLSLLSNHLHLSNLRSMTIQLVRYNLVLLLCKHPLCINLSLINNNLLPLLTIFNNKILLCHQRDKPRCLSIHPIRIYLKKQSLHPLMQVLLQATATPLRPQIKDSLLTTLLRKFTLSNQLHKNLQSITMSLNLTDQIYWWIDW